MCVFVSEAVPVDGVDLVYAGECADCRLLPLPALHPRGAAGAAGGGAEHPQTAHSPRLPDIPLRLLGGCPEGKSNTDWC